jgi:cytochrome c biogenesis protein CcmG, thiol:disulfide interchange protein DsbE
VKSLIVLVIVLLIAGCDRGSHPRMIGSPAPDFTIRDSDHTVSLHDYHGKKVILNFWASTCEPCIEEMPALEKLQQQMGTEAVIVGISTDASDSDYHRFLHDYQVNFVTVRDPSRTSTDLYRTTGQPETFIIDPQGVIRRKFIGPAQWNSPEMVDYLKKL